MMTPYYTLNWLGLALVGLAVQWSLQIWYRGQSSSYRGGALPVLMRTIGWLFVLLGILGPWATVSTVPGLFVIIAALFVAAAAVGRYRVVEGRTLIWQLRFAVEKGLPLDIAARSFACERSDELGDRAEALAQYLRQGVALEKALHQARLSVPVDLRLALRLGKSLAVPHPPARPAPEDLSFAAQQLLPRALHQSLYVTMVLAMGSMIVIHILMKQVPSFEQIYLDFELPLPTSTQWGADIAQAPTLLIVILLSLVGTAGIVTLCLSLYFIGWLTWEPFPIRRMLLPFHSRTILRALADQVEQQQPISNALSAIADSYPKRHMRVRLGAAQRHFTAGQPWWVALRKANIVDAAASQVLQSAERLGNLPWALREMGDSRVRRFMQRVSTFLRIAEPSTIVIFGGLVCWICLAVMTPIIDLIKALT